MTPTDLMQHWRTALAEGSDAAFAICADNMEESENPYNVKFGELLRMYLQAQTMVRMSIVPPTAFGKRYAELLSAFKTPATRDVEGEWGTTYNKPIGPFYLGLTVRQAVLGQHLNLLSEEPVRELTVTECRPSDPDFALILRNYRMDSMFHLTLSVGWRSARPGDIANMAKALKELSGPMMQRLTITGLQDRGKTLQAHFMMGRNIAKGCELFMCERSYELPTLVRTK